MACRGAEVVLLHMDNLGPWDQREMEKVKDLARSLSAHSRAMELYSCPFWEHQAHVSETCASSFQCVLCKRVMLMIAQAFARRMDAEAIITGDSLGQVASQTLRNLLVEQRGLELPVLRPLIGLDKIEIEAIARRAGTFDISIRKSPPCPYLPSRPQTAARPEAFEREEAKLAIEGTVNDLMGRIEKVAL